MRVRLGLGVLSVLWCFSVPAVAAPFREVPFGVFGQEAPCVRATGAPGELVSLVGDAGAQLQRVGLGGISAAGFVGISGYDRCPTVAGQANGAAVLAAVRAALMDDGSSAPVGASSLEVSVRNAGGGFGAPMSVARGDRSLGKQLAVAISARGDAVMAGTAAARGGHGVPIPGAPRA